MQQCTQEARIWTMSYLWILLSTGAFFLSLSTSAYDTIEQFHSNLMGSFFKLLACWLSDTSAIVYGNTQTFCLAELCFSITLENIKLSCLLLLLHICAYTAFPSKNTPQSIS